MIEFTLFAGICLAIVWMVASLAQQALQPKVKPVRIETEEELRKRHNQRR